MNRKKEGLLKIANDTIEIEESSRRGSLVRVVFAPVYVEEYWGPNNNGDAFPLEEVKKYYKTFEKANVHLEHDLTKVVGRVEKALYDDLMKRIVVSVVFDIEKVPEEVIENLRAGIAIGSSMGCRVAYDVCTVCGHISRTPYDKCEHIQNNLLNIDKKTGELVYMRNFMPIWDDISIVANPADVKASSIYQTRPGSDRLEPAVHLFKKPKKRRYDV